MFALGTIFGFGAAWLLIQSSLQPSKEISKQYGALGEQLRALGETTSQLQRVLADRSYRGKWGEKRALEILELAGFERDKHFRYQSASTNDEGKKIVPDFTIQFPNEIYLHMDSKFPLDHYEAYTLASNEQERQQHLERFLKSVRLHVDELKKKGYASPGQGTVSYVLLFIPFESLFRFIHEKDSSVVDYALERQVVMCSPLTLYVLLSTIRQSIDVFAYSQAAGEIRAAIEQARKELNEHTATFDDIGKHLKGAQVAYDSLGGTREKKLLRAFNEIERVTDKYRTIQDIE